MEIVLILGVVFIRSLAVDIIKSVDSLVVCHHIQLTIILSQVLFVLISQFSKSDEQLLLISLENLQVRVDEVHMLFLGEIILEFLQLDSLLLFFAVLV